MLDGNLSHYPRRPALPNLSEARDVRSEISLLDDSLQVVVSWDLTLSVPEGRADSIRVEVISREAQDSVVGFQAANQAADTVYLRAPVPGFSASGRSCVGAIHQTMPTAEACTPWQYVRPAATAQVGSLVSRIVVQPHGLQVDPDIGGRCAAWQQAHPHESVWTRINQVAVPDCTGPNGKPTVAQFCAFAVLPDGRRTKTANSAGNSYCDQLFEEWSRERES
jgi:hypothetical protein